MAERFEIRPLGRWDRKQTDPRRSSGMFRASWDDTVAFLLEETERLGAGIVVVQVDADAGDIRRDGMLRARASVDFPGVKISFQSEHGPLTYATDAYDQLYPRSLPGWQANVRAIALSLQALRAVDRYGVTGSGEQYRGWTAIGAKPAEKTLSVGEAAEILARATGCMPGDLTTSEAVQRAFRTAARTAHPDAGGSADAFRLISAARNVLIGEAGGRRG